MNLKRYWLTGLLLVMAIFLSYMVGFQTGKYSDWISASEPPMPTVTIEGKSIEVFRGSYSWSHRTFLFGPVKSVSVDMISPEGYIAKNNVSPVVVSRGAKIESHFDRSYGKSIREFTLRKYQAIQDTNNPYFVPQEKGIYFYEIIARWRGDQGDGTYFFVVEVK